MRSRVARWVGVKAERVELMLDVTTGRDRIELVKRPSVTSRQVPRGSLEVVLEGWSRRPSPRP